MPSNLLSGWSLLILLAVILLIFGASKLPALAKSMGQSARVFKGEMKAMKEEDAAAAASSAVDAPPAKNSPTASTEPDAPDRTG